MKRTSINPSQWGLNFQLSQAELVEGADKILFVSGQVSIKDDPDAEMGMTVEHPNDLAGQMTAALGNIDKVLEEAGMTRADITHVRFYTTDVDALMANYGQYAEWIAQAGIKPANTLLGVARLAMPEMVIEIEISAAA